MSGHQQSEAQRKNRHVWVIHEDVEQHMSPRSWSRTKTLNRLLESSPSIYLDNTVLAT